MPRTPRGQNSPNAIAYETHLLSVEDGWSESDDELESLGPASRPHRAPSRSSKWPVVLSVVCVLTVCGGLVAVADFFQADSGPFDRECLKQFKVAEHLGIDSPYPVPVVVDQKMESCKLVHLSMVARGGLQNPTETAVKDLDRLENWLHANLDASSAEHPAWLETWKNDYTEDEAGKLSEIGEAMVRKTGSRLKAAFTSLPELSEENRIRVRTTQEARSVSSAEAFLEGLIGNDWKSFTEIETLEKGEDMVLKFSDRCHVFTDLNSKVSNDNEKTEEIHLERVARRVSRNLDTLSTMEVENVVALIAGCQLDLADQNRDDLLCSLITAEDWMNLEILREDGSPYLRANDMYPFLSRPLWDDVLHSMENCLGAESAKECNLLDLRFGTESTLLPFLLRLGIKSQTSCSGRLSSLAPIAGNIVFELYSNCAAAAEKEHEKPKGNHIVKLRLHEKYIQEIPICGNKSFCEMDELRAFVAKELGETDDWEEACETVVSKSLL